MPFKLADKSSWNLAAIWVVWLCLWCPDIDLGMEYTLLYSYFLYKACGIWIASALDLNLSRSLITRTSNLWYTQEDWYTLQWRQNERNGVSNHRRIRCLHQSFASLAFVCGIHRWPVNSPHKRSVTRKMFPSDDVTMIILSQFFCYVYVNPVLYVQVLHSFLSA